MGWGGALFGAWIGSRVSGPIGALIGGVLGHYAQNAIKGMGAKSLNNSSASEKRPLNERQIVFCATVSAMLAKIAKADGHVTRVEIAAVERAFAQMGFEGEVRDYCVRVFRAAKSDQHTIYEYAHEFASIVESVETRELLYELLWQLAAADGVISVEEQRILRNLPRALGIRQEWYGLNASRYGSSNSHGDSEQSAQEANPYDVLGVPRDSSYEAARAAYRQAAKRYHPDLLRAQGVPEEVIGSATEKMARINAAWDRIEAAARR